MAHHSESENQATLKAFQDAVNMTARQLDAWLKTDESQSVGMKEHEGDESTGHQSGQHIVDILHKKKPDYTEGDYNQMRRVVSYVHRHLAQKPASDIEHSRWRYSLKNWGHDPMGDKDS